VTQLRTRAYSRRRIAPAAFHFISLPRHEGAEWGLNGPWSITAEYLHANLGKGSHSTTTCSGAAPVCAAFAGISLEGIHNGFSSNSFRVGINYWFGYWEP